jgi:hypothetical protein
VRDCDGYRFDVARRLAKMIVVQQRCEHRRFRIREFAPERWVKRGWDVTASQIGSKPIRVGARFDSQRLSLLKRAVAKKEFLSLAIAGDDLVKVFQHRVNSVFAKCIRFAIRLLRPRRLRRSIHSIHIVGALFVLSYVSFQVLDLDLSDFPLKHAAAERASAVLEAPEATQLSNVMCVDSFGTAAAPEQICGGDSIRSQESNLLRHAPFRDIRIHLHRLTIPLPSPSDPSVAA